MVDIDKEHPDYLRQKRIWQRYRDLYTGGHEFKARACEYLLRRQKEAIDVYGERLERVFYENYIGSIVDWYASTLFRRAPSLMFEESDAAGQRFLSAFADDCDRTGTTLTEFFRHCFIDALVFGQTHILIDFPQVTGAINNRAEEDAAGLSRAYLVGYQPESLINWSTDASGHYEWVVLRQELERQPDVNSPTVVRETVWQYYDRSSYRIYKRVEDTRQPGSIQLVAEGPHGLIRQQQVPLTTLKFTDGLWLMNKAAQLQLEHFNKSNALGWAITMGLFAMPVIYSDREWNQIVGESYYIQLAPGDRFGWTEPDGKVYQIAAQNLETLKEEIYRVCYLSQASGEMAGGRAQSAQSKQQDSTITKEVLRAYASATKECIRKVLMLISDARQDSVTVSVSGLDEVDIEDFATELKDATSLLNLGIQSKTLKRQVFQRIAAKYLNDVRQEIKDQIAQEIDDQLAG